jgi:hypothetical protein
MKKKGQQTIPTLSAVQALKQELLSCQEPIGQ